jgi:hypothetical protein
MDNANKSKTYYYLKIKDTFLTSDTIDYLISQDGGNGFVYEVLYQSLCFKTINTDGRLERVINEVIIPYDIEKLRRDLRWFTVAQLQRGLSLFAELGLVYKDKDGVLTLTHFHEMVGSETGSALDKRRHDFRTKLIKLGATPEEVDDLLKESANVIYEPIYKVYKSLEIKRLEIKDKSLETKEETPYQSSPLINQRYTNDKPSTELEPCVEFLFDYGYLSKFDTEDAENVERYSNLFDELIKSYGSRNVHVSLKYFISIYCYQSFVDGKFDCWRLRDSDNPISNKFNLLRACMVSNCKRFEKGSDSNLMAQIDNPDGIREELMKRLEEEFPVGDSSKEEGGSNV